MLVESDLDGIMQLTMTMEQGVPVREWQRRQRLKGNWGAVFQS
jgi:hypothetical protein